MAGTDPLHTMALLSPDPTDMKRYIKMEMSTKYKQQRRALLPSTKLGCVVGSDDTGTPIITGPRIYERAIHRLRLGHTTLNGHLYRIGKSSTPHCPHCPDVVESVEHFLIDCPHYSRERAQLQIKLWKIGIRLIELKNVLNNSELTTKQKFTHSKSLNSFLNSTGQLGRI